MGINRSTFGKMMFFVVLAASYITCVNAYAQSFQEYNDAGSGGYDSPAVRERHTGPPREAIETCEGLGESEACAFTSPRGDEVAGTCEYVPGDKFACVPEGGLIGERNPPDYVPPAE